MDAGAVITTSQLFVWLILFSTQLQFMFGIWAYVWLVVMRINVKYNNKVRRESDSKPFTLQTKFVLMIYNLLKPN